MDRPHHSRFGRNDDSETHGKPDADEAVVIPVAFGARRSRRHGQAVDGNDPQRASETIPGLELVGGVDDYYDAMLDNLVIELTPRQRRFVEVAAWTLADDVYDAADDLISHPESTSQRVSIASDFPPCTWTQPVSWWREQARCFDDLAADAQAGTDPDPRCTGEEMALHLILQRARAMAADPDEERSDLIDGLDPHPSDHDWDGPLNFLFQDHDVLTLFDNDLEPLPGAANLDPADWFTPFIDNEPRDTARGFRR